MELFVILIGTAILLAFVLLALLITLVISGSSSSGERYIEPARRSEMQIIKEQVTKESQKEKKKRGRPKKMNIPEQAF